MGFSDNLRLEAAYPEYGVPRGAPFQTKSLYAGGGEFTITVDGQLVEHRYRYEEDPERSHPYGDWPMPKPKRVSLGDRVIAYHGDILLIYNGPDKRWLELVARFTQGRLEWLRPLEEYPEENRVLLIEQGAR